MNHDSPLFNQIYRQYAAHVLQMARHFGVPHESAEDVAQAVWITTHQRLPELDLSQPLKPWLTRVVMNHARRERRGRLRRSLKAQAVQSKRVEPDAADPTTDREAAWLVERLLAELPEEQLDAYILCEVAGHTAPEVSEILDVPLNTVYSRLRIARRRCQSLAASLGIAGGAWLALLRTYHARLDPTLAAVDMPFVAQSIAAPGSVGSAAAAMGRPMLYAFFAAAAGIAVWIGARIVDSPVIERVAPPALPDRAPPEEDPTPAVMALSPPPSPPRMPRGDDPTPARRPAARRPETSPRPARSLKAGHALISAAQAALAQGRTDEALALIHEHRSEYPEGPGIEIRDFLRIRVYCAREDTTRARAVAREHPHDSQFKRLLQSPCSSDGTP